MKFRLRYDVTIGRPVDEVFPVLALADDLERVLRLSDLVTYVTVLGTQPGPTQSSEVITFEFGERVPMLPGGRCSATTKMRVEQTVDSDAKRVDYRSRSKGGPAMTFHKERTFAPVGDSTKVSEVIQGNAPTGLHLYVRRTARKAHVEHMSSYHRLFEDRPDS